MRLFTLPDGAVGRKDRCLWLTAPFDLAFGSPSVAPAVKVVGVGRTLRRAVGVGSTLRKVRTEGNARVD